MADFKCPRREEVNTNIFKLPESDHWREDGRCSYCGSMSGDDFMEAVRKGDEIGPTDKNYKCYVGGGALKKFYFMHLTTEQKKEFVDLLNKKAINIGYPGHFYSLPFFIARE